MKRRRSCSISLRGFAPALVILAGVAMLPVRSAAAQTPPPLIKPPALPRLAPLVNTPRVVSFRVTDGPYVDFSFDRGKATKIEIEIANFTPPTDDRNYSPALFAPGCQNGGLGPSSQPGGTPFKMRWNYSFIGIENAGKTCSLELQLFYGSPRITAGTIVLPRLQTYTITSTGDLLNFTTASGARLSASALKGGTIPCELGSLGTAGAFSTGVVIEGGALTFQLRNGLLQEDCQFETNHALVVKPEWAVSAVNWQFTTDSRCSDFNGRFGIQASSGQTVTSLSDESAVFRVIFQATCMPDANDPAKNSHLYKAKLASVQLVGPPGLRWQDAFK
jgi:hypothetical protein